MRAIRKTTMGLAMAVAFIVVGCASQPHQVMVSPQLDIASGSGGGGGSVTVSVADSRPQPTILGYRSANDSSLGDAVLASNSVSQAVAQSLRSGLRSLGFNPTAGAQGPSMPHLRVTIKNIKFQVRGSGVKKVVSTDVLLAGAAENAGRNFQATYRVRKEQVAGLVVNEKKEQKVVNAALSAALDNMLQDNRLVNLLRQ